MKKVTEEYFCDICGRQADKNLIKTTIFKGKYIDIGQCCLNECIIFTLNQSGVIPIRDCAKCEGKGYIEVWDGPCNNDYHTEACEHRIKA